MSVPSHAIGSTVWPGTAKLSEECGELLQVLGKLAAYPDSPHPDGTDLIDRLHTEIADVLAAAEFVIDVNRMDMGGIIARRRRKLTLFRDWHAEAVAEHITTEGGPDV